MPGGAPLWILALWASFALTLNHSLRPLVETPRRAGLAGFLGGPLAYLGASRLRAAVRFSSPMWRALCILAVGWAVAVSLLGYLARRKGITPQRRAHGQTAAEGRI